MTPDWQDDDTNCWSPRMTIENISGTPEIEESWFSPPQGYVSCL